MNEIVLNKAEIIERACNQTVPTDAAHRNDLEANLDAQDVFVRSILEHDIAGLRGFSQHIVQRFG